MAPCPKQRITGCYVSNVRAVVGRRGTRRTLLARRARATLAPGEPAMPYSDNHAETLECVMVSGQPIRVGDTVKDKKLGKIWTVVSSDGTGNLEIERNGVIITASLWDLERW